MSVAPGTASSVIALFCHVAATNRYCFETTIYVGHTRDRRDQRTLNLLQIIICRRNSAELVLLVPPLTVTRWQGACIPPLSLTAPVHCNRLLLPAGVAVTTLPRLLGESRCKSIPPSIPCRIDTDVRIHSVWYCWCSSSVIALFRDICCHQSLLLHNGYPYPSHP